MDTKTTNGTKTLKKECRMLMKLVENQELEDVAVMDIGKEAHINRTTFYAHYEDIYDLVSKVERLIRQEFTKHFRQKVSGCRMCFIPFGALERGGKEWSYR